MFTNFNSTNHIEYNTDHVGNVCNAGQDEEDCVDTRGGEDQEEHLVGIALGDDSEASR